LARFSRFSPAEGEIAAAFAAAPAGQRERPGKEGGRATGGAEFPVKFS